MPTPVSQRVEKRRQALRAADLRPVQIGVPDTRQPALPRSAAVRRSPLRRPTQPTASSTASLMSISTTKHEGGDLVTVVMPGDFGKPRPALVVQTDQFQDTGMVTVFLMSSTLVDAPLIRPTVEPTAENGLLRQSQVQVDEAMSVRRDRIGGVIGRLDDESMLRATRSLAVFLGVA